MRILYLIGDDKLGRKAINALGDQALIVRNRSVNHKHIIRLVMNGSLNLLDLWYMAFADWRRTDSKIPDTPIVKTNDDLRNVLRTHNPDIVICYRAGIIISSKTLSFGPRFLNIHCADLPEFGGLGAIRKSLKHKAFAQNACLHKMISLIDAGEVLVRRPFELDPRLSYGDNENRAYDAGLSLLLDINNGQIARDVLQK